MLLIFNNKTTHIYIIRKLLEFSAREMIRHTNNRGEWR